MNPNPPLPPAANPEENPKPKNPAFDNVVDQTKAQSQGQKPNNGPISQSVNLNPTNFAKNKGGINPVDHAQPQGLPETPKTVSNPTPKPTTNKNENQGSTLDELA